MDTLDEIADAKTLAADNLRPRRRRDRWFVPVLFLPPLIAAAVVVYVPAFGFDDAKRSFVYALSLIGTSMCAYGIVKCALRGQNRGLATGWTIVILGGVSILAAYMFVDYAHAEAASALARSEDSIEARRNAQEAVNKYRRLRSDTAYLLNLEQDTEVLYEKQFNLESEHGRFLANVERGRIEVGVPFLVGYGAVCILVGLIKIVYWLGGGR